MRIKQNFLTYNALIYLRTECSAAAPVAVLEAALAAANMAVPSGATTTPGAAATPAIPDTDSLL